MNKMWMLFYSQMKALAVAEKRKHSLKVAKKKRMEFLKQQRDRLMAKKKEEREAVLTL